MPYEPRNYDHLLGIKGFSDQALKLHFELYRGYVTNTNRLADTLRTLAKDGKAGTPEYNELKRRFGWEFNGMRLHEYYFGCMSKDPKPLEKDSRLQKKIAEDFGSFDEWQKDFKGTAMVRGIGWGILYYDASAKVLHNVFVNEHFIGHLAGEAVILPIDVFEHAYIIDYGLNRAGYVDAFLNVVDWSVVSERFDKALQREGAI